VLDQRGRLLRAALGFAGLSRPLYDHALWALQTWLDSWAGIGRIAVGMGLMGGLAGGCMIVSAVFYPRTRDVGDGRLTDKGPDAAIDRYVVDLGPVDLATPGTMTYRVSGLPRDESFAVGLQITAADTSIAVKDSGPLDTLVTLKMLNEASEMIVEERGPLSTWGWTYRRDRPHEAFVYRAGRAEKAPIDSKIHTYRRLDVKPDGGWGSIFTPRGRGRYSVTLEVEPGSEGAVPVEARLQMRGGGWK
jgi:hypothetical protein